MATRAEDCCTDIYACSLRVACYIIGGFNLTWMTIGVAVSPELLQETEYLISFLITVTANIILILAALFEITALLLVWFAYAVEFLLGFPLVLESVTGYYRKLYQPINEEYPMAIYCVEFFVLKTAFIYYIRLVCSYYLVLTQGKSNKRDAVQRPSPSESYTKIRGQSARLDSNGSREKLRAISLNLHASSSFRFKKAVHFI